MDKTVVEVRTVEFIERGWPAKIDRDVRKFTRMFAELENFISKIEKKFDENDIRFAEMEVLLFKLDSIEKSIKSIAEANKEFKCSVENDIKNINSELEKHKDEHESDKGILSSILAKFSKK